MIRPFAVVVGLAGVVAGLACLAVLAIVAASLLAIVPGCLARVTVDQAAWNREVNRVIYNSTFGPFHVAAVVGAGGTGGLSAVVADYGQRAAFAELSKGADATPELPPSPWEVPDPNPP